MLFFVAMVDWAEGRILTDDDWLENKDHWLLAVHLDESDQGDVESLRLPLDACSVFVASSSAESSSHMAEGKAGI